MMLNHMTILVGQLLSQVIMLLLVLQGRIKKEVAQELRIFSENLEISGQLCLNWSLQMLNQAINLVTL